jgi:hypothetical protein
MDKKYRRVLGIMSNYFYHPRKYTSVSESREIKLNDLLGVKVRKKKKIPDFMGVSPNSQENKERMFVFNYFYKLNKDDNFIMNEWLSLRRARTKDIDYNTMPKLERKDNLNPVTNTFNYGSSGGNISSIRVPSKKRKNKMKNFKKLFNNEKN